MPHAGQARHKIRVHDGDGCVRVFDDVLQDAPAVGGIDRHVHGAEVVDRVVREQHVGRVGLPREDVVSLPDAEALESGGDAARRLRQLPIGQLPAAVEDRVDLIRLLVREAVDQVPHDAILGRRHARVRVASGGRYRGFHTVHGHLFPNSKYLYTIGIVVTIGVVRRAAGPSNSKSRHASGERHVPDDHPVDPDAARLQRPTVRRGSCRGGRAARRETRLPGGEQLAPPQDRRGDEDRARARLQARRHLRQCPPARAARGRLRRGCRGRAAQARPARLARRRLRDRRDEDPRALPQARPADARVDGALPHRRAPGQDRHRARVRGAGPAGGADPDDAVGWRVQRAVGRDRQEGQRQAGLRAPEDDGRGGDPRPRRQRPYARVDLVLDRRALARPLLRDARRARLQRLLGRHGDERPAAAVAGPGRGQGEPERPDGAPAVPDGRVVFDGRDRLGAADGHQPRRRSRARRLVRRSARLHLLRHGAVRARVQQGRQRPPTEADQHRTRAARRPGARAGRRADPQPRHAPQPHRRRPER